MQKTHQEIYTKISSNYNMLTGKAYISTFKHEANFINMEKNEIIFEII